MSPEAYLEMAETEAQHWWFRGRRDVVRTVLRRLTLPPRACTRVLEIGSGTGGNFDMLTEFGSVSGVEMDKTARDLAAKKTGGPFDVRAGRCPDDLPFDRERFDLICFFDSLEHIADDVGSLARMRDILAPGGTVVATVPAYQWLWSAHDVFLHHHRRYSRKSLIASVKAAGYRVESITYFNALLLPLLIAVRIMDRQLRRNRSTGNAVPSSAFNESLYRIFSAERHWISRGALPCGVSLMVVLKAEKASQ